MATWDLSTTEHHVLICNGGSCMRNGGEELTQSIRQKICELNLDSLVHTTRTKCNGRCSDACVVIVYPEGVWYKSVTPDCGQQIIEQHLLHGQVVREHVMYQYKNLAFTPALCIAQGKSKGNE